MRGFASIQTLNSPTRFPEDPRLKAALSLIEFEWNLCQIASDKRMFIDIMDRLIRTIR